MRDKLTGEINNSFVIDVMDKLCAPIMNNNVEPDSQIRAIKAVIAVLKKFSDFHRNRNVLLKVQKLWEEESTKEKFIQLSFNSSAALGSLIHAYSKKDDTLPIFKQAITVVLGILTERKLDLEEKSKLLNSDSQKRKYQPSFFTANENDSVSDTPLPPATKRAKQTELPIEKTVSLKEPTEKRRNR